MKGYSGRWEYGCLSAWLRGGLRGRCLQCLGRRFCPTSYSPASAGVWAEKLGRMAGVSVPLIAMHHAYVVTERIDGIQVRRPCPCSSPMMTPASHAEKTHFDPCE